MSKYLIAFLALLFASAAYAAPSDCSRHETSGRILCHELAIDAAPNEVWALFATSEGLGSWLAPVAAIDLRIGGIWEASYAPDGRIGDPDNIRNRILSYLPGRMLSIAIDHAPPDFQEAERARKLWTIIEFEPLAKGRTRVRISMAGYGDEPGDEVLWTFFERGNAFTLEALQRRVTRGPTVWAARD